VPNGPADETAHQATLGPTNKATNLAPFIADGPTFKAALRPAFTTAIQPPFHATYFFAFDYSLNKSLCTALGTAIKATECSPYRAAHAPTHIPAEPAAHKSSFTPAHLSAVFASN
jgi:hypothetical protein